MAKFCKLCIAERSPYPIACGRCGERIDKRTKGFQDLHTLVNKDGIMSNGLDYNYHFLCSTCAMFCYHELEIGVDLAC